LGRDNHNPLRQEPPHAKFTPLSRKRVRSIRTLENEVKKTPFKSPVATAKTYPVVKETLGGLIGTICKGAGAIAIASGLCETH
jgi:hypothetical protein